MSSSLRARVRVSASPVIMLAMLMVTVLLMGVMGTHAATPDLDLVDRLAQLKPPATPFDDVFPAHPQPKALPQALFRIDHSNRAIDDQLTLLTLQGCLGRLGVHAAASNYPLLFKTTGAANTSTDTAWTFWAYYQKAYAGRVQFRDDYAESSVADIVKAFSTSIRGYYLANYTDQGEADNVNTAISMASITDGAIVTTPVYQSLMQSMGIPLLQDMRAFNESTFLYQFAPLNTSAGAPQWPFARQFIASQTPTKGASCLTDFSMISSTVTLHHIPTANAVLAAIPEGKLFAWLGWTADTWGENDMTRTISIAGGVVWASDVISNLGTFAFFRDPLNVPVTPPTPINKGKHTVAFLFTDGDSFAADAGGILDNNHWTSPDRGTVPLSWGVDPSLAFIAPSVLGYYYDTATTNDQITAFGPGYAYPSYMTEEQVWAWADAASETMGAAGMSINYYIDFNYSSQYFGPLLQQPYVAGAVYFDYPNYYVLSNGRNGTVTWVNEKPCIAVRDSLWTGHSTPASIATELNQLSTDHTTVDGYSVIAVHLWSQTVDTVKQTVDALGDQVLVVRLDELVSLMTEFVPHENRVIEQAPERPKQKENKVEVA